MRCLIPGTLPSDAVGGLAAMVTGLSWQVRRGEQAKDPKKSRADSKAMCAAEGSAWTATTRCLRTPLSTCQETASVSPCSRLRCDPADSRSAGPEVTAEAVKVLHTLSEYTELKFTVESHDFGGIGIDNYENPLPPTTLAACQKADAILLGAFSFPPPSGRKLIVSVAGAVGGPKWGTHPTLRPELGLLALRKELGLYANIRPALFPAPSLVSYSPLKAHIAEGTEIIVVRELIGGIYFGDRKEAEVGALVGEAAVARDECSYSVGEVERITRMAGYLAGLASPPLEVHSVDKANVLATSRLWRRVVGDVMAKEFPDVKLDHSLVDSAAMVICSNPRKLNGILLSEF